MINYLCSKQSESEFNELVYWPQMKLCEHAWKSIFVFTLFFHWRFYIDSNKAMQFANLRLKPGTFIAKNKTRFS